MIFMFLNTAYRLNSFFNIKKDQWQGLLTCYKFHYSREHYSKEKVQWNEKTTVRLSTNLLNNLSIMAQRLGTISKIIKKVFTFLQ